MKGIYLLAPYFPWCECCASTRVEDSGSKVKIPIKSSGGEKLKWRISSGTCIQRNHGGSGKLCDFLLARESSSPAYFAVELKSRVQHAGNIADQIQSGATILEQHGDGRADFSAILVKSRGVSTHELRILRTKKINYRGVKHPIQVANSGCVLSAG